MFYYFEYMFPKKVNCFKELMNVELNKEWDSINCRIWVCYKICECLFKIEWLTVDTHFVSIIIVPYYYSICIENYIRYITFLNSVSLLKKLIFECEYDLSSIQN